MKGGHGRTNSLTRSTSSPDNNKSPGLLNVFKSESEAFPGLKTKVVESESPQNDNAFPGLKTKVVEESESQPFPGLKVKMVDEKNSSNEDVNGKVRFARDSGSSRDETDSEASAETTPRLENMRHKSADDLLAKMILKAPQKNEPKDVEARNVERNGLKESKEREVLSSSLPGSTTSSPMTKKDEKKEEKKDDQTSPPPNLVRQRSSSSSHSPWKQNLHKKSASTAGISIKRKDEDQLNSRF